ncbi:MAG: hypothetical protein VB131_04535 [Burkholderia gladioli]
MTAATSDRDTPRREATTFDFPAKGGRVFFVGALVAIDSAIGFAAPVTGAATETVVGVSVHRRDTSVTADGATVVKVRRGCFRLFVDPANPYTLADVGTVAHALDDTTLSKAGKAVAGIVRDVDDSGVWIEL